ncbi:MAG: flagellar biosynthesis protein FliQ [Actinomycetota bacterium]|nr:flagellar biosynthesis protein FliQ [Actinomycetota bacterium]
MESSVIHIVAMGLLTAAKLAAPVLVGTLVVGLLLSILQSATQIQESTLTFLPKLAAAALLMVVTGAWCLRVLEGFTLEIFGMIPTLLGK